MRAISKKSWIFSESLSGEANFGSERDFFSLIFFFLLLSTEIKLQLKGARGLKRSFPSLTKYKAVKKIDNGHLKCGLNLSKDKDLKIAKII
ncbi:hypothetical protein BpHYR1_008707 [Brachionus plicatilis]|uniref:Uncharacterized protein n=1 Tax=Brachionus plicatilis TaxID=10195 RepID=A0A3M7TAF8_BRAPC|nr:hypothetical protein BpHYR1_008707 [Brachionus plicatilis]